MVLTWWTFAEGGYASDRWLPGAIVVLVTLAVVLLALGRAARPPRPLLLALAALAAYTAWSYLSITWADAPGIALEGSHRTLAFLALAALFAVLPWTPRAGLIALAAWTLMVGVAALALTFRLRSLGAGDVTDVFIDGQLKWPLDYQNATAGFWTMAAVPALVLAARRETGLAARPLLLAEAGLLLSLGVMTQSRGWLFALPVVAVAVALLVPDRVRLLLHAVPVGIGVALTIPPLLDPYDAAQGRELAEALPLVATAARDAAGALLALALVLAVVGVVVAALDRRFHPSRGLARAGARLAAALVVAGLVAGAVVGWAATDGKPVDRVDKAWEDFKDYDAVIGNDGSRFGELGSSRYDFWRVAVDVVGDHPIAGVGQDNYAADYLARRDTGEEPRWTHSLPLRLLTHTGIVGTLLFAAFVVLAAAAALRRRAGPPLARAVAAAALLPGLVWLVHGSIDWFWESPAMSGAALAFAALAGRVREVPSQETAEIAALAERRTEVAREEEEPAPRRRPPLPAIVAAVLALLLCVPLALAFAADRAIDDAARHWPADPRAAYDQLDRARSLNGLSARASLVEGLIAQQTGELGRARRAFVRAADREPRDWFARFELGLVDSARGQRERARANFRRARERNPREPLIRTALRRVSTDRPLTFDQARAAFARRVARRTGKAR